MGILSGIADDKIFIAVCDDVAEYVHHIKQIVENELSALNIAAQIDIYIQAESLMESETEYDIIFLDIEMPQKNGLLIAEEFRKKNKTSKIVFLTGYKEYMQEAFKVHPFRYLYKTDSNWQIRECIMDAIRESENRCGIVLEVEGQLQYLLLDKILYIQALGDEVLFVLKDKSQYIVQIALKKAYADLQNRFVKCSRGMIVNLAYINRVGHSTVFLEDGFEIQMSVRERKNVQKRHKEYFIRQMIK